nr:MAG TPA: hypothetical protein [Caudoviricetes sp.]
MARTHGRPRRSRRNRDSAHFCAYRHKSLAAARISARPRNPMDQWQNNFLPSQWSSRRAPSRGTISTSSLQCERC